MNKSYLAVPVRMTPKQFAEIARKAARKGVFLVHQHGQVLVPTKIGADLACRYAARIAELDTGITII